MTEYLNDPIFFYAVAFAVFLILAWKVARKPAAGFLDAEIAKIQHELDRAKSLRIEATAALANARIRRDSALREAEEMIVHARNEAVHLANEAAKDLKFRLAKHEEQALERIRFMEQEALTQIRAAAVDQAMTIVHKNLAEKFDDAAFARLTDQAIADMPSAKDAKARAA